MSTTPSPTPRSTPGATLQSPSGAAPAPSLTERRKAETRMEIARAAAALFVRQGLRATRAEDIAQRAGIAPRTFYRYFASKEEAVAPLYAVGAQRWAEAVRSAPDRLTVPQALEHAVEHTLTPGAGVSAASWEWVRTLIRLTDTSPALRKVWAEVGQTSEEALAEILARRLASPGRGKAPAAETEGAAEGTAAGEPGAADETTEAAGKPWPAEPWPAEPWPAEPWSGKPEAGEPGAARDPIAATGGAEPAMGPARPTREPETDGAGPTELPPPVPVITPDLRFAAAVAGSAVRVAVQSWAATTSPAAGPDGPAALALRNLRALGGFAWGGER